MLYDRLGETAAAPGLGDVTLGGVVDAAHRAFDDLYSDIVHPATNVRVVYLIELASDATTFEIGRGLYSKSGITKTVVRSTVRTSSAANAKVNFSGPVKVYITVDAHALGPETGSRLTTRTAGTTTAYTATMVPALRELIDGMVFLVEWDQTCGASPTLAVDGLTARALVDPSGAAIAAGTLVANSTSWVRYRASGTTFVVLGFNGGTITVDLTISKTDPQLILDTGSGNQVALVRTRRNGLDRWVFGKGNGAEGGSSSGSDFAIIRYNDAGTIIDAPLTIVRSSALVTMTGALTVGGDITPATGLGVIGGLTGSGLRNESSILVLRRSASPDTGLALSTTAFAVNINGVGAITVSQTVLTTTAVTINAGNIALQSGASLTHAGGGNTVVNSSGHLVLRQFANFGALPSAASFSGSIVQCLSTTTPGLGALPVTSDGASWRDGTGGTVN